jgi:hypothetical protein
MYEDDYSTWKSCGKEGDDENICGDDHICVQHMWAYNDQTEAAQGCWEKAVCSNANGAYYMFDKRIIQWFCSQEQIEAAVGLSTPYGLKAAKAAHFETYADSCIVDGDCGEG